MLGVFFVIIKLSDMLNISIICIGKTNEQYVKIGLEKYTTLLSKHCKFELIELADVKNSNKLPRDKLKDAEAELILNNTQTKSALIFLDEIGKTFNSENFAEYLDKKSNESSKLTFVIGGSYGLQKELKLKGESIALSALTFNHQMVRVILAEQLFRAFSIIKNTGYHH